MTLDEPCASVCEQDRTQSLAEHSAGCTYFWSAKPNLSECCQTALTDVAALKEADHNHSWHDPRNDEVNRYS